MLVILLLYSCVLSRIEGIIYCCLDLLQIESSLVTAMYCSVLYRTVLSSRNAILFQIRESGRGSAQSWQAEAALGEELRLNACIATGTRSLRSYDMGIEPAECFEAAARIIQHP